MRERNTVYGAGFFNQKTFNENERKVFPQILSNQVGTTMTGLYNHK